MCAGARAAVIGLPGATVTHGLSDKSVLNITITISHLSVLNIKFLNRPLGELSRGVFFICDKIFLWSQPG